MNLNTDYDLVIAGGSIAGAALGFAAQRAGARVLIVEPEPSFRDRVRGETLHPWGMAEAKRLGLFAVIEAAPAHAARHWDVYVDGERQTRRTLEETTPGRLNGYNAHHPELQSALLTAAEAAGASVRRGAKVLRVEPGAPAVVVLTRADGDTQVSARLAVVADGRHSPLRRALGIAATGELSPMLTSGVLLEGVHCDQAAIGMFFPRDYAAMTLLVPLPGDRARLYRIERRGAAAEGQPWTLALQASHSQRRGYTGPSQWPALLERSVETGVPASWFAHARVSGPLATFDATCWSLGDSDLPRGVALIGDAAGNVDPVFGCGQSLALRDARQLVEHWSASGDWQLAAARYMQERRAYHAALLRIESWLTRILFTPGPQGDALREVTGPRLEELGIDLIGLGPDSPSDDATEAQLFAGVASASASDKAARPVRLNDSNDSMPQ